MLFPLTLDRRALSAQRSIERLRMQIGKCFRCSIASRPAVKFRHTSEAEIRSDRDNRRLVIVSNRPGLLLAPGFVVHSEHRRQNIFIDFEIRCLSIS